MAGQPVRKSQQSTEIADAAHDLFNLVKKHCPAHCIEPERILAEDDFVARAWRNAIEATRDALIHAEELESWLYEKAELPNPTRRDLSVFDQLHWVDAPRTPEQEALIAELQGKANV